MWHYTTKMEKLEKGWSDDNMVDRVPDQVLIPIMGMPQSRARNDP